MAESIFLEVRADFIDENENKIYVDGWLTPNDNEEGQVIAKIDLSTFAVEYIDTRALICPTAQNIIKETIDEYKNKPKIKIYDIPKSCGEYSGTALIAAESAKEANQMIEHYKKTSDDNNKMGLGVVHEHNVVKTLRVEPNFKGFILNSIRYFSPHFYD